MDEYLDGWLDQEEATGFERHLLECPECAARVEEWEGVERRCAQAAPPRDPEPSSREIDRLVLLAASEERRRRWATPVLTLAGAAAAAAAVLMLLGVFRMTGEGGGDPEESVESTPLTYEILTGGTSTTMQLDRAAGATLTSPGNARIVATLEDDTIGLEEGSSLKIEEARTGIVRLVLERGAVACSVSRRDSGEGFSVEAGDVRVAVRGTRFQVSRSEDSSVSVGVAKGEVLVLRRGEELASLESGDELVVTAEGEVTRARMLEEEQAAMRGLLGEEPPWEKIAAAAESMEAPTGIGDEADEERSIGEGDDLSSESRRSGPPRRPISMTLSEIRKLIVDGRSADAEDALEILLQRTPGDVDARMLLGDCRRNSRDWKGALAAYERVVESGDSGKANRARFLAGTILQDRLGRHAAAIGYFEDFLSSGSSGSLAAEARLRLAISLDGTGRRGEARGILEKIASSGTGTLVEARAIDLLKKMEDEK